MSKGIYHDLSSIYSRLNLQYFQDQIRAHITWGRWGKSKSNIRSIRLGSYDASRRLITIHPAMDQACVPRLCVERIVYHEMLHEKHPVRHGKDGRRLIHTEIFRQDEKQFLGALIADQWFQHNLDRILRHKPLHLKNPMKVLTN